MIIVQGVSFGYVQNRLLFKQLDLKLLPGKVYGLLGKNGVGKSTLLKLMAGFLFPTDGSIDIDEQQPKDRHPDFLSSIYYLNEDIVMPSISIVDYIKVYSPFYSGFDRNKMSLLMNALEIDSSAHISNCSHGQKKKFLLAFAISTGAKYMIWDEPTNGLDIPSKTELRKIMAAHITEEQTVIISTHQVKDLSNVLDAVIILDGGEVLLAEEISILEEQYSFTTSSAENKSAEIIYSERIPGGFINLSKNISGVPSQLELEVFFNAILTNKSFFSNSINK